VGELVARELTLPDGLKIERRIPASNTEPTSDFALRAPDGSEAELEAKALRPEKWKKALDKYEKGLIIPRSIRTTPWHGCSGKSKQASLEATKPMLLSAMVSQ